MGVGVQIGEKGIGLGVGKDLGDVHPLAQGEEQTVHALSADDGGLLSGGEYRLHGIIGGLGIRGGEIVIRGQHDVAAAGQPFAAGQALQGLAAHQHGLALRQFTEALHVGGDVEQQVVILADAPILGYGGDGEHRRFSFAAQIATGISSSKGRG